MRRRLDDSRRAQRLILGALILGYAGSMLPWSATAIGASALLMLGTVALIPAMFVSMRTMRLAHDVARLAVSGAGDDALESRLAHAITRFTLYRSVRVVLYHHLARLRLRQGRLDEASAVCDALLRHRDAPATGRLRQSLLIILAEARLRCGDAIGAYGPMLELHRADAGLSLTDRVHALALRIRYETLCGRDAEALIGLKAKLATIDLMPPGPAAICHDRLALAARRTGRCELADWLTERADLLGGDRRDAEAGPFDAPVDVLA